MKTETSCSSERGVALVITLILLSVITFMAVTFLVISRHGAEQVNTNTQQVGAELAAKAGAEQSVARIISSMMATTNGFAMPLVVSTDFQNLGFDPTQPNGVINVTNVNYHYANGTTLSASDNLKMLNNLLVLPRAPVFITTNKNAPPDFRYYLDLNRNGVFDPNGPVPVVDQFGNVSINYVGDPEWIGILQHPDQPHSRSNLFIARYAFIAVPIGNSLDINHIHNHANPGVIGGLPVDGFLRDQGVGTWEINLAGFLNGLNPNYWSYSYNPTNSLGAIQTAPSLASSSVDANSILSLRNNGSAPAPFGSLYPWAAGLFSSDGVDGYSDGLLSLNSQVLPSGDPDNTAIPWSGSDNTNHIFSLQDLFNPLNVPNVPAAVLTPPYATFSARLANAANASLVPPFGAYNDPNFGRYTFYRMLAQLSMESAPEFTNKLNLNYNNAGYYVVTNGNQLAFVPTATTNFINYTPIAFFTNAADRLLRAHTNFIVAVNAGATNTVTNLSTSFIPIYPLNYYTPSVHRMLQLAANLYDATVNNSNNIVSGENFDYPSVFRPTFGITNIGTVQTIYINGYVEVGSGAAAAACYNAPAYILPDDTNTVIAAINSGVTNLNIYGAPWVIGAKKGFPNFNQASMQSFSQISRKLQIIKPNLSAARSAWHTNVQYIVGVSNELGVQAWNSYLPTFARPVHIGCVDTVTMYLTNENGVVTTLTTSTGTGALGTGIAVSNWVGYPAGNDQADPSKVMASFRIPMLTTVPFMPDAIYHPNSGPGSFTPVTNYGANIPFDTTAGYPLPQFGLNITNRLRFVMVDDASGRVLDYVQLAGMNSQRQLTAELMSTRTNQDYGGHGGVWVSNRFGGTTSTADPLEGIVYQVQASLQNPPFYCPDSTFATPLTASDWANMLYPPPNFSTVQAAVQRFNDFYNKNTNANSQLSNQVPYTPTRQVSAYFTWQANDPLVHYTLEDLTGLGDLATKGATNYTYTNLLLANVQRVNDRYLPWGNYPNLKGGNPAYNLDPTIKDPGVTRSDDWQFPTGKFANIGEMGRVHRGTPWQTVYMKPAPVALAKWQNWTGNGRPWPANPFLSDASIAEPTNDWAIFDLFTTAPNDNATMGQLSINQTNYAAWAAIFTGVPVVTNPAQNTLVPLIIDPNPAGNLLALSNLVASINAARAAYPGGVFTRLGDILSAPALTTASPFLNTNDTTLTDSAYERLPQQIMSLLRVGSPRYVIYAYGQSLKPADNSIQVGGPFYGTCTNYQITGEVVTRTVVRFEPSQSLSLTNRLTPLNPTQNPVMPGSLPFDNLPRPRAVIESFNELRPE